MSLNRGPTLRTLAITQNVTVDGAIEMLGGWFDPQGQADVDSSDLLEEVHRQDRQADGFLAGRRTFEDLRSYWPQLSDDFTGISDYLNRVQKYVVSSTMTDPQWQNSTVLSGDPIEEVRALKEQPGQDIVGGRPCRARPDARLREARDRGRARIRLGELSAADHGGGRSQGGRPGRRQRKLIRGVAAQGLHSIHSSAISALSGTSARAGPPSRRL